MTILGLGLVAIFALLFSLKRMHWLSVIACSAVFFDSAFINAGTVAITPYYFFLLISLPFTISKLISGYKAGVLRITFGGNILLLCLTVFLTVVISYFVFQGIGVVDPKMPASNEAGAIISPLIIDGSVYAQIVYLMLNISLLLALTFVDKAQIKRSLQAMFVVGLGVALIVWIIESAGFYVIHDLFDNSTRNFYATELSELRFRAQFSEPSHLALFAVAGLGFFFGGLVQQQKIKPPINWSIGLSSILMITLSGSSTAFLSAGMLILVFIAVLLFASQVESKYFGLLPALVMMLIAVFLTRIVNMYSEIVSSKVGGYSYKIRTEQDAHAWRVLEDTNYLGSGLGTNATSSFFTYLLSNIGILGSFFFFLLLLRLFVKLLKDKRNTSSLLALSGVLIASFVAVGLFGNPILWFIIATAYGLISKGVTSRNDEKVNTRDLASPRNSWESKQVNK